MDLLLYEIGTTTRLDIPISPSRADGLADPAGCTGLDSRRLDVLISTSPEPANSTIDKQYARED
jgi:hypothetical protein